MLLAASVPHSVARPFTTLSIRPRGHTATRYTCRKQSRLQLRYKPHLQACQSVSEDRDSPYSQPESPDNKSRRSLQVTFTCNKCGGRTERLVNPLAWDKGLVYLQCKECEVWHKMKDNQSLIEEVHLTDT